MRVGQVCHSDLGGGAERTAVALHDGYRSRGHRSTLYVGRRRGNDPDTVQLRNGGGLWRTHDRLRDAGRPRAARIARAGAAPGTVLDTLRGREDFAFPGTWRLVEQAADLDVLQLHNLHGAYFDLRALPALAERTAVVLTPHDAWLTTGHCAHSLGSERWRTGCGQCPHLRTYPALLVDGTAGNWQRKAALYRDLRVRVGVPSRWLADAIADSMLAPAVEELRVIPNGVDVGRFRAGDAAAARRSLSLPADRHVIVFAAQGGAANPFKDHTTLLGALEILGAGAATIEAVLLGGEPAADERRGNVTVRSVGAVPADAVPDWLAAADLYVHSARADTYPLAVLEALAAGVPVVASAVGGIPEQVTAETGALVAPGDARVLAEAIAGLLADESRRAAMSAAAAADAAVRFDVSSQIDAYLAWFEELAAPR